MQVYGVVFWLGSSNTTFSFQPHISEGSHSCSWTSKPGIGPCTHTEEWATCHSKTAQTPAAPSATHQFSSSPHMSSQCLVSDSLPPCPWPSPLFRSFLKTLSHVNINNQRSLLYIYIKRKNKQNPGGVSIFIANQNCAGARLF